MDRRHGIPPFRLNRSHEWRDEAIKTAKGDLDSDWMDVVQGCYLVLCIMIDVPVQTQDRRDRSPMKR
jgi:hypothetical protein